MTGATLDDLDVRTLRCGGHRAIAGRSNGGQEETGGQVAFALIRSAEIDERTRNGVRVRTEDRWRTEA